MNLILGEVKAEFVQGTLTKYTETCIDEIMPPYLKINRNLIHAKAFS